MTLVGDAIEFEFNLPMRVLKNDANAEVILRSKLYSIGPGTVLQFHINWQKLGSDVHLSASKGDS